MEFSQTSMVVIFYLGKNHSAIPLEFWYVLKHLPLTTEWLLLCFWEYWWLLLLNRNSCFYFFFLISLFGDRILSFIKWWFSSCSPPYIFSSHPLYYRPIHGQCLSTFGVCQFLNLIKKRITFNKNLLCSFVFRLLFFGTNLLPVSSVLFLCKRLISISFMFYLIPSCITSSLWWLWRLWLILLHTSGAMLVCIHVLSTAGRRSVGIATR